MRARGSLSSASAAFRATLAVCAVSVLGLVVCPLAGADVFSAPTLVSVGAIAGSGVVQQAEYAHDSALSGDGRYVAFDGSIGGVTGVWRRDLATGVVEQVAGGDARMPSISEDGRYVSFTTNEGATLPEITDSRPDSSPRTEAVNVYRRDMDIEPAATAVEEGQRAPAERAFQAASVRSYSTEPLRYSGGGQYPGSYAIGRTAMSADGDAVAFVTTAVSNLVPYPALEAEEALNGQPPAPRTPAGQVAVHHFGSGVTELVSRCSAECEQGSAAGASEPVVSSVEQSETVGAVALPGQLFPSISAQGASPGASISADGNAVVWVGRSLAQQAPMLPGEHIEARYEEPLWRRLPAAANSTRRVTGGSDPEAPGCAAGGERELQVGVGSASDPCQGPFLREQATANNGGLIKTSSISPRLSADGEEVVFGANARLVSQGSDFGRGSEGNETDVFVADMAPGLTRTQALTPLTEVGPKESKQASDPVVDAEISPDGTQVAFATDRTAFALGTPTLISPPAPEVQIRELFDADLADATLTRVTHGFSSEAEPSEQPTEPVSPGNPYSSTSEFLGALTPSFTTNGDELAFTSTASNLVYGDGNSPRTPVEYGKPGDGSDVFVVARAQFVPEFVAQLLSAPPAPALPGSWRISATASARRNGTVVISAWLPGVGSLRVAARGSVVLRKRRKGAHGARRAVLVTRTVSEGAASERSGAGGSLMLTLRLHSAYSALATQHGGLPATLELTFTSPGRRTLNATVHADFRRVVSRRATHRDGSGK